MQQWSWSRVNFSCGDCSPGGTSRFHWRSLLCWRQITSTSPSAQHFCYDFDILTGRNTNGNGFHNLGVANPVGPASESLFCSFTAWWNPQNDFTPRDCGLKSLPKKSYDKWHPRHKLRRLLKFWVWRSIKHSLECLLMNASR